MVENQNIRLTSQGWTYWSVDNKNFGKLTVSVRSKVMEAEDEKLYMLGMEKKIPQRVGGTISMPIGKAK